MGTRRRRRIESEDDDVDVGAGNNIVGLGGEATSMLTEDAAGVAVSDALAAAQPKAETAAPREEGKQEDPTSSTANTEEAATQARRRIAELQDARLKLVRMLALLDPGTAASLPTPSRVANGVAGGAMVSASEGPGLASLVPLLLAPILQPLEQQQRDAASTISVPGMGVGVGPAAGPAARLGRAVKVGMRQARELAAAAAVIPNGGAGAGTGAATSGDDKAKTRKGGGAAESSGIASPSAAIRLATEVLAQQQQHQHAPSPASAASEDTTRHPILVLRKRKREAELAERAARRQRAADAVQFLKMSSDPTARAALTIAAGAGAAAASTPSSKRRRLHFETPVVGVQDASAGAAAGVGWLHPFSLRSYLARLQAHPSWRGGRIAAHPPPPMLSEDGSTQHDTAAAASMAVAPTRAIRLCVHASVPNTALVRIPRLLQDEDDASPASARAATAAVLVQIEGVLTALLTLGVKTSGGAAGVVVVHANIRHPFEAGSSGGDTRTLADSAHLASAYPLHRALSADLMTYLARRRRLLRLGPQRRDSNSDRDADEDEDEDEDEDMDASSESSDPDPWSELGAALMFVRGLRTIEDAVVPPPPPPPPLPRDQASSTQDAEPVLGFSHLLDDEADAEADGLEVDGDVDEKKTRMPKFGQAPVRWAWCEEAPTTIATTTAQRPEAEPEPEFGIGQGKSGKPRGEWLAFNLGAAATAPLGALAASLHQTDALLGFVGGAGGGAAGGGVVSGANGWNGTNGSAGMGMSMSMMGGMMGMGGLVPGMGVGVGMPPLGGGLGLPPAFGMDLGAAGANAGGVGVGAGSMAPLGMEMGMGLPLPGPALGMPLSLPMSMGIPFPGAVAES